MSSVDSIPIRFSHSMKVWGHTHFYLILRLLIPFKALNRPGFVGDSIY